ncbi:hypothetical protein C8F04DRAFT_1138403, partial [Mycena alexandri]
MRPTRRRWSFALRTCRLHIDRVTRFSVYIPSPYLTAFLRKFTKMGLVVLDEDMGRIRGCYSIKTQKELDEFVEWCKNSEHKVVRG